MKNGRKKGNLFELSVSMLLHNIMVDAAGIKGAVVATPGKTPVNELLVRRRTTTVAPMDDWTGAGDLQFADRLSSSFLKAHRFLPCVECKAVASLDMADVLLTPSKVMRSSWIQACQQSDRIEDGSPLLAVQLPRRGILLLCFDIPMSNVLQDSRFQSDTHFKVRTPAPAGAWDGECPYECGFFYRL